jgi:hypothetical protein
MVCGGLSLFPTNPNGPNVGGVHIAARKNFMIKPHRPTLSWQAAFAVASNETYADNRFFMLDVPVFVTCNWGYGSKQLSGDGLGFFVGGGLGTHYMADLGWGLGPEMVMGFRAKVLVFPIELRANYRPDPLHATTPVFGLHLSLMIDNSLGIFSAL